MNINLLPWLRWKGIIKIKQTAYLHCDFSSNKRKLKMASTITENERIQNNKYIDYCLTHSLMSSYLIKWCFTKHDHIENLSFKVSHLGFLSQFYHNLFAVDDIFIIVSVIMPAIQTWETIIKTKISNRKLYIAEQLYL